MTQTLRELTVGGLVVENPSRARVFEKLGIDYCCGGKKPLSLACKEKGLSVDEVVRQLDLDAAASAGDRDWSAASLTELCDHIQATHHAYLKEELPRLEFLATKVAARHGEIRPNLVQLRDIILTFKEELQNHMAKEEMILFPLCRQLDSAEAMPKMHCGSVDNPIRVMIAEHDDAGDALSTMRQLTDDYTPPLDACNTFRAFYDSLKQLEADMHQHVHKENNILFPKASKAERLLQGSTGF